MYESNSFISIFAAAIIVLSSPYSHDPHVNCIFVLPSFYVHHQHFLEQFGPYSSGENDQTMWCLWNDSIPLSWLTQLVHCWIIKAVNNNKLRLHCLRVIMKCFPNLCNITPPIKTKAPFSSCSRLRASSSLIHFHPKPSWLNYFNINNENRWIKRQKKLIR